MHRERHASTYTYSNLRISTTQHNVNQHSTTNMAATSAHADAALAIPERKSIRKLASIQSIAELSDIPKADRIQLARILGWNVVVPRGDFKVGDLCVYFEIDSLLMPHPAFEKIAKAKYKVRTAKFMGQVSQGFAVPIAVMDDTSIQSFQSEGFPPFSGDGIVKPAMSLGTNVTAWLRVQKIEDTAPGRPHGPFPDFIPQTDEVRLQACPEILDTCRHRSVTVSEKLDGVSVTIFSHAGCFGACSRNCEVSDHPGSKDNYIWDQIKMLNLSESLPALGRSLALQGELVGPDLQSNKLRLQHRALRLFRIFDIDRQMFLPTDDFLYVAAALNVKTVPIIQRSLVLDHTVDQLVEMATGRTVVPSETAASKGTALPLREGLVFVFDPIDAGGAAGNGAGNGAAPVLSAPRSFKVINPMFLLKHEC